MRRSFISFTSLRLALVCAVLFWSTTSRAAIVFAPPENSPDAATELKGIDRELNDKNFQAAAKRLDILLSSRTEQLANLTENTLISVIAWLDQLPPPQRAALATEYAKSFNTPARQSLDSLQKNRTPTPDELYALARRFPMTPTAASALTQAADRSLQLGDLPAAQALYELALHEGAPLGEARAHKLEALKKFNSGITVPAPADLESTTQNTKPQPKDRQPLTGRLPFDAPWYGNPALLGYSKFFPFAYEDRILLSSWKGVAMLRENGEVLWTSPNPTPPGSFPVDRPAPIGRGALFAPATLSDIHGRPVIIVVRQPTAQGDSQFILRALRAADGKTLWSTNDTRSEFTYAGLPSVGGRYVYCMAVQKTGVSSGNLLLCALDINTGQSQWQSTLGTISEQGDIRGGGKFIRGQPLALESFADLSEPAVNGDLVLISPNCGSLIAVSRFDGKIRWVYSYRQADATNTVRSGRLINSGDDENAQQFRYRSTPITCGEVVLTMPQDASIVVAVDRASGKRRWETSSIEGFALAGASGNIAIITGPNISAIDAITAKLKWKYQPPRNTTLTGPAVVLNQTIIAPTTSGFIQLSAIDGKEKPIYSIPNLRHTLSTESAKPAITDLAISKSFGVSAR